MDRKEITKIYEDGLIACIVNPFKDRFVNYDEDSGTLTIIQNDEVIHTSTWNDKNDYDAKLNLLLDFLKNCVEISIQSYKQKMN